MSTAGMGVNTVLRRDSSEVGVDLKTEVGTLFRMELRGDDVVARHDRGEVDAEVGDADADLALGGLGVVRMHEVEIAAARYVVEQRMPGGEAHLVPADLRHLQARPS